MTKGKVTLHGVEFNFNTYFLLKIGELIGDDKLDAIFAHLSSNSAKSIANFIIASTAEFYESQGKEQLTVAGACKLVDEIGMDGLNQLYTAMSNANQVKGDDGKKKAVRKVK